MEYVPFPMTEPLIAMTHVCRSWRNVLVSTPSLWTQIDFGMPNKPEKSEEFLRRSGGLPLDIHHYLEDMGLTEPFLSITLNNMPRLRHLELSSCLAYLGGFLEYFLEPAPELEYLRITHDPHFFPKDMELPGTIFGGRLPKLTSLTLVNMHTDLRKPTLPGSLTWFSFTTRTQISFRDLTSFLQQHPLLEFLQICLQYTPQPPVPPPHKRIRLAVLKELRFDQTACTSGLLDHLILPKCTEMLLKGQFIGKELDEFGGPSAQIHPSSIDHLPVMRGITKAVAMPNSCVLSGPNGHIGFWCFQENRRHFDADFLTSFSPISVSGIRELWVGAGDESRFGRIPWGQTSASLRGAFETLTEVEDLTIVSCETGPVFSALCVTMGGTLLLPRLRRVTIYEGCGGLNFGPLTQSAIARKQLSRPLEELTIIFDYEPEFWVIEAVERLRVLVGKLSYRVDVTPVLRWEGKECDLW